MYFLFYIYGLFKLFLDIFVVTFNFCLFSAKKKKKLQKLKCLTNLNLFNVCKPKYVLIILIMLCVMFSNK